MVPRLDQYEELFANVLEERSRPYRYQVRIAEALSQGNSVILRAPTGSGKSESVWVPFLCWRGGPLPMRMIHILPTRALVNQLESRLQRLAGRQAVAAGAGIRVAAMHGQRPETALFYADAILATLDQVVSSYACAPLSLSVRQGNIPAGAVAGSFLVFDEVHTFEPELGLQSALVLAERAVPMQMPFIIMSATLPDQFAAVLSGRLRARLIDASDDLIAGGKKRAVKWSLFDKPLSANDVLQMADTRVRTLVVVNTVQRALDLYEQVRNRWHGALILAHSRFYDDDRATRERQIEALFGKDAPHEKCLLIATQVVEVGLDISCDLLLTELAPVDSLIQRAGRCARWGGAGDVMVFQEVETTRPYAERLVAATRAALSGNGVDGRELTPQIERTLLNQVLDPYLERWGRPEAAGRVLVSMAEAVFTGNPAKAEQAVRDGLGVEVALHDAPHELGPQALGLPRCRLDSNIFQQFVRQLGARAWRVVVDRKSASDYSANIDFDPYSSGTSIMPGALYVVSPAFASYDSEFGLRFGRIGNNATPLPRVKDRKTLEDHLRLEFWQKHAARTVKAFDEIVLPKESVAATGLAKMLGQTVDEVLSFVRLVLILHDLGKLNIKWQKPIQAGLKGQLPPHAFLAHRGGNSAKGLPAHATISCWVATPCLCRVAGSQREDLLAIPGLAAIAHHHSIRANMTPEFSMADGWFQVVATCCRRLAEVEVVPEDFNVESPLGGGSCGVSANFLAAEPYTTYVLLSRWLRLADRIATGGGEDAVLRYEEWFGNT